MEMILAAFIEELRAIGLPVLFPRGREEEGGRCDHVSFGKYKKI
jgi:hypothetical protein